MCEYCGCQAVSAIAELTREHDHVVALIGEVRTAHAPAGGADAAPRMADLARRISAILDPHTLVEEGGLFPALACDFPQQIAALVAEHRLVAAVLGEAASGTPADPTWPDRLMKTLDVLRDHILKEQDGVFPAALTSLRPEQWEVLEAIRAEVLTHDE